MKQIPLSKSQVAIVDDDMYDYLMQWKWHAVKRRHSYYAERCEGSGDNQKTIYMHRLVVGASKGVDVDHQDGNGLHNYRSNLRLCTGTENSRNRRRQVNNTSGYKGVSWHRNRQKYQAKIKVNGKQIYLGVFEDVKDAADAYDKAALYYFGSFASVNRVDR